MSCHRLPPCRGLADEAASPRTSLALHPSWSQRAAPSVSFVRRPCHPRATSDGQAWYPADNHGHSRATHELALYRSSGPSLRRFDGLVDGCAATLGSCEEPERLGLGIPLRVLSLTPTGAGGRCRMRKRLSWVSVAVGLLVAVLFLVPTASRSDVRAGPRRSLDSS